MFHYPENLGQIQEANTAFQLIILKIFFFKEVATWFLILALSIEVINKGAN